MGGPIVRSGASPEFSKNWDRIFGGATAAKSSAVKPAKKTAKKKPIAASLSLKAAKGKKGSKKAKSAKK